MLAFLHFRESCIPFFFLGITTKLYKLGHSLISLNVCNCF